MNYLDEEVRKLRKLSKRELQGKYRELLDEVSEAMRTSRMRKLERDIQIIYCKRLILVVIL